MKPLSPNTLLQNRYLVVHLIGKGGMGEVYLAVDQRLGSAVALKRTFFSDDDQLVTAFEREARTLARLRHPALPKVSDHFTENDTQYLVMEHISGEDLAKRLEITKKPFPLNWVLFWGDQLLDALAYLHSHEPPIVHRDIKPQNLKLTNENHVILLDFGLAKNSEGQTHYSTGGSIVGYTPHYAPMEQIRGTGTTAKSDLYSLSATIYHLLSGQVPADALSRADDILNGLSDPIQPLNEANPEIPSPISKVILKGMELSADKRYASAREMQKALRDAYSEMQNRMGEQTMAFDTPKSAETAPQSLPSQMKTEQFSVSSQLPTAEIPANPSFEKTEVLETANAAPIDFDMTLKDSAFVPTELPNTHQKTEVLDQKITVPPVEKKEEFNPEATLPLINFDKSVFDNEPVGATQAVGNYDSIPTEPKRAENAPIYDSPYNTPANTGINQTSAAPKNFNAPKPNVQPVAPKKGNGKMIVAVLGILGFLVVAAAAGVYTFSDKLGLTGTNPTPTPVVKPSVAATPTPQPTIEQTNTNAGNSSNVVVADTNTNANTKTDINTTAVKDTKPTPLPTAVPRQNEPTVVKPNPPVPRQTPAISTPPVKSPPKPAPTAKPSSGKPAPPKTGGRTDIEQ